VTTEEAAGSASILDGKINAALPLLDFLLFIQCVTVTACRRKRSGADFPENPMESMRIASPIAVLGSGQIPPTNHLCPNANDIKYRSAIPTSSVRKGPERGEGSSPVAIRDERTGEVRQPLVSYM
jgi:hypothetical protein